MDVYISVAATANERHFAYPQILSAEQNELHLEEVFHPFLSAPKGNSLSVDAQSNVIFLTGANMAGKSTFMKSVSTHIIEVGHALQQEKNIAFAYLPTVMKEHVPVYTYRLQPGITNDKHGMLIIQNEHIVDIIRGRHA